MVSAPFNPTNIKAAIRTALAVASSVGAQVALTGGAALEAWGVSRATQDIDFVFLLAPTRLDRLLEALRRRGALILEQRDTWTRVLLGGIQIDWLRAWDVPTTRALRRAVVRPVLGMRLKVLRPEDLMLLKLRVGRPRDLDDAARLYVLLAPTLDQRYLKQVVRQLHLSREWAYLVRTLKARPT